MKERIAAQIKRLDGLRDKAVENFLTALDSFTIEEGSMQAIGCAGVLHDLDKHITALHMELKRLEVSNG